MKLSWLVMGFGLLAITACGNNNCPVGTYSSNNACVAYPTSSYNYNYACPYPYTNCSNGYLPGSPTVYYPH